jgi:hypothetical protein
MFPKAEAKLVDRLGAAISRLRAILQYRKRHREKLSQELRETFEPGQLETTTNVSTEFANKLYLDEAGSDAGVSQTSYRKTLFNSNDHITIPYPKP